MPLIAPSLIITLFLFALLVAESPPMICPTVGSSFPSDCGFGFNLSPN